jgi:hypothetical protein
MDHPDKNSIAALLHFTSHCLSLPAAMSPECCSGSFRMTILKSNCLSRYYARPRDPARDVEHDFEGISPPGN